MVTTRKATGVNKTCPHCRFVGDSNLFREFGRSCSVCYSEQMKAYRDATPELSERRRLLTRINTKQYRKENPDKIKKAQHKYYLKHKEESLERTRKNRALKKLEAQTPGGAK